MSGRLVSVADVVVDVVLAVPGLPVRGGDVLAGAAALEAGGCGRNVLAAAVRQGLTGVYAGTHGTGPLGDLARAALAADGIATLNGPEPGIDTGFTVALVEPDGERTFVTSPGAEACLSSEHLAGVRVVAGDAVHVSGYGLAAPGPGQALAAWLPTLPDGVLVLTDPGPLAADIPAAVLGPVAARTDWWTCNALESRALTGEPDPSLAASVLAERFARLGAVVRLGADGCVVAERGRAPVAVPGFAVPAVDTNGAGDAHTGILAAGFLDGRPSALAAARANAGAALAVTRRGPATAPTAAEIDRFAPSTSRPAPG